MSIIIPAEIVTAKHAALRSPKLRADSGGEVPKIISAIIRDYKPATP